MKTIVVKIGSSVLLTKRNKLDEFRIAHIAEQVKALYSKGYMVVLVISGAVACGANYFNISNNNKLIKKLAAGVGQAFLTSIFYQIFQKKKISIAQILLTQEIFKSRDKSNQLINLIQKYSKYCVIPVINENDVIDLNSFGGNDFLAGDIALRLKADKLLILSTVEGSRFGVGGGKTKQEVISKLDKKKIKTDIVDGKVKNIILKNLI